MDAYKRHIFIQELDDHLQKLKGWARAAAEAGAAAAGTYQLPLRKEYQEVQRLRTILDIEIPDSDLTAPLKQIYVDHSKDIESVSIVTDISLELKKYLARHPERLYDLSPRNFEILVADIMGNLGFDVQLTQATRDGGYDIYALLHNQISTFLMLVECKKWRVDHPVGIQTVQRLYGVAQINQANKCMLVTTSFFTRPAIEEQKKYSTIMDLRDYNDLKRWLEPYS